MLGGPRTIGPMEFGDDMQWVWSVVVIAFVVLVVALNWFATVRGRNTRSSSDEQQDHLDSSSGPDALGKAA